ncbi:DUF1684 domain-containing protein [Galbibacter mesophilus]|uniref:DUF1684 domain-containing protein n=1 Tax=Galbibacter mesophilus TaxID=379069 RepID=UPI00191EA0C9|nr:DUF1684 domain-containing protein [Galbibacter mesophilus]MCM5661664.1 DUF1684 domain-containing protein [Galbibacter mesophilus]
MKKLKLLILCLPLLIACNDGKKYHNANEVEVVSEAKSIPESKVATAKRFQQEINEEYNHPEKTPLTKEDFLGFEGLDFFPIDTSFSVIAKLERTPDAQPFLMPTTTGDNSQEKVYGILHFSLHGKDFQLNVYQNQQLKNTEEYRNYLFLPFSDKTNGNETYAGGRYIDLSIPEGDSLALDFNKAYNPYCAYNEKFSCPIVPKENNLDYPITVGVKKFTK